MNSSRRVDDLNSKDSYLYKQRVFAVREDTDTTATAALRVREERDTEYLNLKMIFSFDPPVLKETKV